MSNQIQDDLGRAITLSSKITKNTISLSQNINTIINLSSFLSTSLGPNGLDKILISPNDEITITNDGSTILNKMEMNKDPISKLLVRLSKSCDEELGDGTTSVVLLAASFLKKSEILISKGLHPIKIIEGFENALKECINFLKKNKEEIKLQNLDEFMKNAAITSLNSKIVSKFKNKFSNIIVSCIKNVFDFERLDLDFELIKIVKKIGKNFDESELINGVLIDKNFSHPQMVLSNENFSNQKIALLSCPFEPPKIKSNHLLEISNVDDYKNLESYEKEKFVEMIRFLKNCGANLIFCQWGFDDEANSLLFEHNLPAVRWIGGQDMELLALYTNGNIVSRFEDLRKEDLGTAKIENLVLGTENENFLKILPNNSDNNKLKTVTILLRGSSIYALDEAERSLIDALSSVRNLLKNKEIVYGGGSFELKVSDHLKKIKSLDGEENICYKYFADALEELPYILERNSGNPNYVNDLRKSDAEMRRLKVFDTVESKIKILKMAMQMVSMVLKIDEIVMVADE